jgi:hypothetical protein
MEEKIEWGLGPWDNEDASDFINFILDKIEKKYFTSKGEVKRNVSENTLIALADFLATIDKVVKIGRPSEKMLTAVYGALTERIHTKQYYSSWADKSERRKEVKKVIDKLYRIMNS